ncbi:Glycine-rich cell wall structural protein 1 [Penicillium daleae]|uniref:Glycine-rich cell wall structural protein 1 n=1 Tax=Penicillium daleae TaxID=63821 RepID=A0AAD6C971_9EURO|nr:Glycine-rich cell wall structural protein 1 [Penicillium daleae]KAJ5455639.1 Glycine-rich cell wall structural protein 1 [Penicillium daleae]
MHFSTPVLTLLAIAAGVQAGGKQHEPPIHKRSVSAQATPVSTGAHPIVTGTPGGGGNATTGGGASSSGAASTGAASSGAASGSAASNTPALPSSTGFVPSSPGIKVSVPQLGMIGAGIGSVAYGALIFLA